MYKLLLLVSLCLSLQDALAAPKLTSLSEYRKAGFADLIAEKQLKAGQVWKLQQHGVVFGDLDVYISKNGLRTDCARSGITVIAQGPRFDVVAFNLRANAIWKPSRDKFAPAEAMLKSLTLAGLPSSSKFPLVPSKPKIVNGLKCETYSTTNAWSKQQIDLFADKRFSARFPRRAEFQGIDLHVPKDIYSILEKIDGAPSLPLLPLEYSYDCLNGKRTTLVGSSTCRIVEAPKDWLKLPTGLKTVTSFQALNMDQAAQSGINELFGDLGR
ncbi:hypothetical protein BH11CYA1_BH11CYA1_06930 [soil metagenome]